MAIFVCIVTAQCAFWSLYSICGISQLWVMNETCIVAQNLVVFCCQRLLKICFSTCQLGMVTWAFQVSTTICHIWLANHLLWNLLWNCRKAVQAVSVLVSELWFVFLCFSLFLCCFVIFVFLQSYLYHRHKALLIRLLPLDPYCSNCCYQKNYKQEPQLPLRNRVSATYFFVAKLISIAHSCL